MPLGGAVQLALKRTGEINVQTITPPQTRLESLARAGHLKRRGHALDSVLYSREGQVWERAYLCCGQTVPGDPPARESRPATLNDVPAAVALAIAQITADIRAGLVPATISAFGELHQFVDANEYGGLCDDTSGIDWINDTQNAGVTVQDHLDTLILSGMFSGVDND